MTEPNIKVKFEPNGRTVFALPGTKLIEAAAQAGLVVDTPCGGAGHCGKCRVRVTSGASVPLPAETAVFTTEELASGWRLACQSPVQDGAAMVVYVPEESLFSGRHQILETSAAREVAELAPCVRKAYVCLDVPTLQDHERGSSSSGTGDWPMRGGRWIVAATAGTVEGGWFQGDSGVVGFTAVGF